MIRIRLARGGAKKRPFYRVVVTDSRSPRDGRFIKKLGYYDPINKNRVHLETDQIKEWIGKGAQLSERVKRLMKLYEKEESTSTA